MFHAPVRVSGPDLMDGWGTEAETAVTIHISELGLFRTYKTAPGWSTPAACFGAADTDQDGHGGCESGV